MSVHNAVQVYNNLDVSITTSRKYQKSKLVINSLNSLVMVQLAKLSIDFVDLYYYYSHMYFSYCAPRPACFSE